MSAGILDKNAGFAPGATLEPGLSAGSSPMATHFLPDGFQLAWDEYGSPSGYPLFYFHDSGSSRLECSFFHNSARRHGFRLIAVDRPGIGHSAFYACHSARRFCGDILHLADHLGIEEFGILSLGAGGIFALTLSEIAPQRISRQVILGGVPGNVFNENWNQSRSREWLNRVAPTIVELSLRVKHSIFPTDPEETLERLHNFLGSCDRKTFANPRILKTLAMDQIEAQRTGFRGIAQDLAVCFRKFDFSLQDVSVSTMVWQGCADRLSQRADCEFMVSHLPHASFHRVPNAGHFFFLNNMDEIFARTREANRSESLAA